ncbi:MAG: aspartyl/asparaginyl beta-hydroxylase domain-containing protein [Pseudomonadota bacterium]|nr:aspartyl/asparaginyl beta-hydroxylase domain-containing protein [Xanthomonadaceae bacterium]MDE2249107.1 aspartyl/asparaginyl beta-hydroxylase domain-containing protein [Xanthomonadaceae bacterium]MDE3210998.1 aspartyl/asparaginyl beta-hydroxylase domain-containing protein [Pseudomonadota bacterium]
MNKPYDPNPAASRSMALDHLRRHDTDAAEHCFRRLLALVPDDVQALLFIAGQHVSRGEHQLAIGALQVAARARPEDPTIWNQLGFAQSGAGDFAQAADSLRRGLALAPGVFVARLQLGVALEQLGQSHEALKAYFMAIQGAHAQGRWVSDATTAPGLRGAVRYAMNYVNKGRHQLFRASFEPLRDRYGSAELVRVERSLAIYFGERSADIPDPRQKPKFLYFPDIPSQPFYPRERFPWLDALEAATATVREELREVLAQSQQLEAFLGVQSPGQTKELLDSSGERPASWDAFFFYRHGIRYDEHCLRCPQTTALLDALPLVRIRDHSPETLFSVLSPGTHILLHTGVTNTRLVTHLPLIVPNDCAIRVGGEDHVWQEGHCVTFDDTFEHEAWNHSDKTRVVLILDTWNPDLSEAERLAVTDLVEAIGDFNQSCELPPVSA